MSARTFLVQITNSTPFALTLTFDHLCHGDWTPGLKPRGDPDPSKLINPGETVRWRSESAGIATGTEGYVKYTVMATEANFSNDIVYIYWDNPFVGKTTAKTSVTTADVDPDCDFDTNHPGGSEFPGDPSKFEINNTGVGDVGANDSWQVLPEVIAGAAPITTPLPQVIFWGNVIEGNVEQAGIGLTLSVMPNPVSMMMLVQQRGFNPSKGIRILAPNAPRISIKALLGIPK